MKTSEKLRLVIPTIFILLITVGFLTNWGIGTLSAPGIADISILCPLGALGTMIATKTIIPRAVVSIVLCLLFFVIFARAFCGWICPVPLVSKLRDIAKPRDKAQQAGAKELTVAEKKLIKVSGGCGSAAGCAACAHKRGDHVDSRHFVLIAALVSTLIFGFPVFCLVCPIGLTFATILLVINLFAHGAVTWSLIFVPVVLLVEVVFFRKWCHTLCPLGALMSLVGKTNKTLVPTIDNTKCIESSQGGTCGRCGRACTEGIDIRHPELSTAALSECIKCRACVEVCPASAITMPLLPVKQEKQD